MTIAECATDRPARPAPSTPSNVLQQFSLKDRVCAITGASGGIGSAVAEAYAEAGANLALWYHSNPAAVELAAKLAKEHCVKVKAYQVDVSDAVQVEKGVAEVERDFGRLDVFVANAGMPNSKPLLDMSLDEVRQLNAVNLDGVVFCAKFVGDVFKKQGSGSLIITSSISAHIVNVPVDQPVRELLTRCSQLWADERADIQCNQGLYQSLGQVFGSRVARVCSGEHGFPWVLQYSHGCFR